MPLARGVKTGADSTAPAQKSAAAWRVLEGRYPVLPRGGREDVESGVDGDDRGRDSDRIGGNPAGPARCGMAKLLGQEKLHCDT